MMLNCINILWTFTWNFLHLDMRGFTVLKKYYSNTHVIQQKYTCNLSKQICLDFIENPFFGNHDGRQPSSSFFSRYFALHNFTPNVKCFKTSCVVVSCGEYDVCPDVHTAPTWRRRSPLTRWVSTSSSTTVHSSSVATASSTAISSQSTHSFLVSQLIKQGEKLNVFLSVIKSSIAKLILLIWKFWTNLTKLALNLLQ